MSVQTIPVSILENDINYLDDPETIYLNKLEEELENAINAGELDTIKNLFDPYMEKIHIIEQYQDFLSTAIIGQKTGSLILLLQLIKNRSANARNAIFNKQYEQCLEYSISKCIRLNHYDLLHDIIDKFGEHDSLKDICLNIRAKINLEKIYDGSINVPIEVPIEIAINRGDIDYVKNHIDEVNSSNNGEFLEIAIDKKNVDMVLLLVNWGANVNYSGKYYLEQAINKQNFSIVQILIDAGINCNQLERNNGTEDSEEDKIITLLANQGVNLLKLAKFIYHR